MDTDSLSLRRRIAYAMMTLAAVGILVSVVVGGADKTSVKSDLTSASTNQDANDVEITLELDEHATTPEYSQNTDIATVAGMTINASVVQSIALSDIESDELVVDGTSVTEDNTESTDETTLAASYCTALGATLSNVIKEKINNGTYVPAEETTLAESLLSGLFMVNVDDYANVYSDMSTDSTVEGMIFAGAGGYIVSRLDGWTLVKSGNVYGYIQNEYILMEEDALSLALQYGVIRAYVTLHGLRMYTEASYSSSEVTSYILGTGLTVSQLGEKWSVASFKTYSGYVDNQYLDFSVEMDFGMTAAEYQAYLDRLEAERIAAEKAAAEAAAKAAAAQAQAQAAAYSVSTDGMTLEDAVASSVYSGISLSDAYLMACVITCEGGNQAVEYQLAIANVIINRYLRAGTSISSVVYAKNQFTVVTGQRFQTVLNSEGPNASSIQAVILALQGAEAISSDYLYFASNSAYILRYQDKYPDHIVLGGNTFYKR